MVLCFMVYDLNGVSLADAPLYYYKEGYGRQYYVEDDFEIGRGPWLRGLLFMVLGVLCGGCVLG